MALQLNITTNIFSRSIADSKINLQRVAAISVLLSVMLAGCGGGGGSGQPIAQPPPPPITFQLIFPGETSLTDSDQISVVGSADANRLMSVAIKNGSDETPASLDSAGRWRASNVPLQRQRRTLARKQRTPTTRKESIRCQINRQQRCSY
jgi:hypothetical protein